MVQLFVYRQAGKRRLYPMSYLCSKIATKQERPAPPLEACRLGLSRLPKRWGDAGTRRILGDIESAVITPVPSFRPRNLLAQAAHIPVHLGSQSESVRAVLRSGLVKPGIVGVE